MSSALVAVKAPTLVLIQDAARPARLRPKQVNWVRAAGSERLNLIAAKRRGCIRLHASEAMRRTGDSAHAAPAWACNCKTEELPVLRHLAVERLWYGHGCPAAKQHAGCATA